MLVEPLNQACVPSGFTSYIIALIDSIPPKWHVLGFNAKHCNELVLKSLSGDAAFYMIKPEVCLFCVTIGR